MRNLLRRIPTIAALSLLALSALFAQGNLGGLSGNVVDSSGAAVPGARVTLRSQATNQVLTTESSDPDLLAVCAEHAVPAP